MATTDRKVALVTGGSRGIGAAIALRLAKDGFNVALTYQKSAAPAKAVEAEIQALGVDAFAFQADAGNAADAAGVVAKVVDRFGRLDVLVNNAGVYELAPIADATDDSFDRSFNINVRAVFLASRAAARVLTEGGRIINISSVLGQRSIGAGMSIYAGTKFAVNGLTKAIARDLAPRGITVNAVEPGPIDTDMNPADGEFAEGMRSMIPMGRYGKAQEIAEAVAFLASPGAQFVTGATLTVDGGMIA